MVRNPDRRRQTPEKELPVASVGDPAIEQRHDAPILARTDQSSETRIAGGRLLRKNCP
jgi:hypothetical protein